MMAFGAMEIFLLLLLSSGSGDLASLLDPNDYFQTRNVPMTVDKMTELSGTDPATGKAQLAQLLALRWLEENAGKVKEAKNAGDVVKQIEAIAKGDKAKDRHGFAAEHAARTARALGSKIELPKAALAKDQLRRDAVSWFPKETTFVAGINFHHDATTDPKELRAARQKLIGMIPPNVKDQIYTQLEGIGNVQLSRYSIAVVDDPTLGSMQVYMRVTGKADHSRLINLFRQIPAPNLQITEDKGPRGELIATIDPGEQQAPMIALVGDNDLLVAFVDRGDSKALLQKMLAVRAGKEKSVLTANWAAQLKQVSPKAIGMAVGKVPEPMRQSVMQGAQGFQVFPKQVFLQAAFKGKDVKLDLKTELDSANDAKLFISDANNLKDLALQGLQNPPPLPPQVPLPKNFFDDLRDTVKSLKLEPDGKAITGSMTIKGSLMNSGLMLPFGFHSRAVDKKAPPAPLPKKAIE